MYTDDCAGLHQRAVDAGHPSILAPTPLDRWPVTVAFVGDPDGYQVEIVQRDENRDEHSDVNSHDEGD